MVTITDSVVLDDAATSTQTGTVGEPSLAASGRRLLVAGNWYASWSADAGATWTFLDPFRTFPATAGGFCCDQVVLHVPRARLWVWFLQYSEDASGENLVRIATSRTGGAGPWRWWDLRPTDLVASWRGQWFDYPDVAVSDRHLWISLNVFAGEQWKRAVVVRYPLAELGTGDTGDSLSRRHWATTAAGSLRLTAGAGSTMWFASTVAARSAVRLHAWSDDDTDVTTWDVRVTPWDRAAYTSPCPDGTDWLLRADDRITGAWRAGGRLGFLWTAGRSTGRPHPFVRGAVIDEQTLALAGEPDLWSTQAAWAYPAAAPSRSGGIGLTACYGGPASYPAHAVGRWDEKAGAWETAVAATSTHAPPDRAWGDYLTIRAHPRRPTGWLAAGFTLQGGSGRRNITPQVVGLRP